MTKIELTNVLYRGTRISGTFELLGDGSWSEKARTNKPGTSYLKVRDLDLDNPTAGVANPAKGFKVTVDLESILGERSESEAPAETVETPVIESAVETETVAEVNDAASELVAEIEALEVEIETLSGAARAAAKKRLARRKAKLAA